MSTAKRKGRVGGAAMMIGMFFATLFDPKKGAAIVQIDTQRRIGSDSERTAATAGALPIDRHDDEHTVTLQ